jgi:hypothetical protein
MGVMDYVMISYKIPTYMQSMPEDLQYWFDRRPVWFTGVWAVSVWSSLLDLFYCCCGAGRRCASLFWRWWVSHCGLWRICLTRQYGAYAIYKIHIFNGLILFSLVFYIFFCRRYIQTGVLR